MGLFGLLGIAVGLGVGTKDYIKGQKLEMSSVENAKMKNLPYYIDSHGQMRSVKTHNPCHYRTLNNGNVVLVDSTDYTILENTGASRDAKEMIAAKNRGETVYQTLKDRNERVYTDIATGKKMYEVTVEPRKIDHYHCYFYADAQTHKLIRITDSEKKLNEQILTTNPKRYISYVDYNKIILAINKKIDNKKSISGKYYRTEYYFLSDF